MFTVCGNVALPALLPRLGTGRCSLPPVALHGGQREVTAFCVQSK